MEEKEWREYEQRVVDAVKWCEERNEGPLVWSTVVGRLATAVPSPELGQVLVSHLCFDHNRPPLWKFIEKSLSSGLLFPIHVLSLLFARFFFSSFSLIIRFWLNWLFTLIFLPFRFGNSEMRERDKRFLVFVMLQWRFFFLYIFSDFFSF